ncbi:MAG: hypothetical protein ACERKN_00780 [Velocimicrobium sp.]
MKKFINHLFFLFFNVFIGIEILVLTGVLGGDQDIFVAANPDR